MRPAIQFIKNNLKGPLIGAEVGVAEGKHAKEILESLDMEML